MGLETGTGIGDLVPTNPLSTDAVSSGDDHIRLIKTVMQSITFLKSIQTFPVTGTWTRPVGVKKILIYCLGGGAGGGGGTVAQFGGGGGGAGASAITWLDVTGKPALTVTVGTGGAGGPVATVGSVGGVTNVQDGGGIYCHASGGGIGANYNQGGTGGDSLTSTGDIKFYGAHGQYGGTPHSIATIGGTGGGGNARQNEAARPTTGGGGGGGGTNPTVADPGGAGGSGYCIILEFGW